jgi:hypothetical protein
MRNAAKMGVGTRLFSGYAYVTVNLFSVSADHQTGDVSIAWMPLRP